MKFVVKGMHCDACKTLISMEIEEHEELASKLISIEIPFPAHELGEIVMRDLSSEELALLKRSIQNAGDYTIIDQ